MKISELIEQLARIKDFHGDIPVISAKDAEGNGYTTVEGVDRVFVESLRYIESVYDSLDEAEICGAEDVKPVALVYV